MSFEKFFWANTSVALFMSLKAVGNFAKEGIEANVIDVQITWVSNYKKFKLDTCNWTSTW